MDLNNIGFSCRIPDNCYYSSKFIKDIILIALQNWTPTSEKSVSIDIDFVEIKKILSRGYTSSIVFLAKIIINNSRKQNSIKEIRLSIFKIDHFEIVELEKEANAFIDSFNDDRLSIFPKLKSFSSVKTKDKKQPNNFGMIEYEDILKREAKLDIEGENLLQFLSRILNYRNEIMINTQVHNLCGFLKRIIKDFKYLLYVDIKYHKNINIKREFENQVNHLTADYVNKIIKKSIKQGFMLLKDLNYKEVYDNINLFLNSTLDFYVTSKYIHGDLNYSNIIFFGEEKYPSFHVIDLYQMGLKRKKGFGHYWWDFARLETETFIHLFKHSILSYEHCKNSIEFFLNNLHNLTINDNINNNKLLILSYIFITYRKQVFESTNQIGFTKDVLRAFYCNKIIFLIKFLNYKLEDVKDKAITLYIITKIINQYHEINDNYINKIKIKLIETKSVNILLNDHKKNNITKQKKFYISFIHHFYGAIKIPGNKYKKFTIGRKSQVTGVYFSKIKKIHSEELVVYYHKNTDEWTGIVSPKSKVYFNGNHIVPGRKIFLTNNSILTIGSEDFEIKVE